MRTSPSAGWRAELVSTEDGLLALRAEWERLLETGAAGTPFQSWWVTYRTRKLEAGTPALFILVVRDANGLVAGVLPLGVERSRRGPFTWRVLMSIAPRRIDCVDVIAKPADVADVLSCLLSWLSHHWRAWDEMHVSPVREDAALASELPRLMPPRLELDLRPVSENFATAIPSGARGWEDVCGGETRRGLRRTLRRLETSGFQIRRVSQGYPVEPAIDAMVRLHGQRRSELGQKSRLVESDRLELARLVADTVAHDGDLWVMERDGAAVAAQLTLRLGTRVSHYRLAFDSAFRDFSPGIGLLIAAIDDAVKAGVTEYDFGFGAEEYKRRWANVRRTVYRLRIDNKHPGRLPRRLWSRVWNRWREKSSR